MTVKRKASKSKETNQKSIDVIIGRGGKTSGESAAVGDVEIRFTLRIPSKMTAKIDKDRKNMIGSVSRNQWILEAIDKQLK
jgi:hypothetical protein